MEVHHTRNLFKGQKVKVKVTRPINAVTDNEPYAGWGITIFLKLACLNDIQGLQYRATSKV